MEWGECPFSPLEETLYEFLSPQLEMDHQPSEWTFEDNKLFENALAEVDPNSPSFFENVASRVPWKSIQEIKNHYQALLEDVEMIESGEIPLPDYNLQPVVDQVQQKQAEEKKKKEVASPSNEPKTRTGQPRRRGVPWTEDEHQLFLMGLNKYGKGDWRSISRYYVITKTPTQVASHAQKYFRRQTSSTPPDRRRPSIHDIQTVSPSIITTALTNTNQAMPNFSMVHHSFNSGFVQQNHMFLPSMTVFPTADPRFNQNGSGSYPASAPCLFPTMRNQQWG